MKTIYTSNYKGLIIRIRKTSIEKDGYHLSKENFVAEEWIYKPEIDCEELNGGCYGMNMMQAMRNTKGLIDTILNNGRKI